MTQLDAAKFTQSLPRAGARNALARLRVEQQRLDEVASLFRQVIDAHTARLGAEHPDTADAMSQLAALLCQRGDKPTGRDMLHRSIEVMRSSPGASHRRTRKYQAELAQCL